MEGIYHQLKAFTSSTAQNGARQGAGSVTYTEKLHRDQTNLYPSMRKVCQVQVVARGWERSPKACMTGWISKGKVRKRL